MTGIKLENITKCYDNKEPILSQFNLELESGEFVVLLGPSGCGKSTLLNIIAGLESIDDGDVYIEGHRVTHVEPKERDVAMVFQNYALYPHMTVFDNIGISLILRKEKKEIIREKVESVAKMLDIEMLLDRKPRQLSGGQMQRVALARAMIRNPKVFLMDEPLSNLDAALRVQTRAEIMKLYHQLGTTTVFVTHDQVEAMTMATQIVLLRDGKIQQQGTPDELYQYPANQFVAQFIGTPMMNFATVSLHNQQFELLGTIYNAPGGSQQVIVGIRPEHVVLSVGTMATVLLVENLGSEKFVTVRHGEMELTARVDADNSLRVGDLCDVSLIQHKLHFFNFATKERIEWSDYNEHNVLS